MGYKITSAHKVFLREFNNPVWNLSSYCILRMQVTFEALEFALNEVMRKNDALRMAITDEGQVFFKNYCPRSFEKVSFPDYDSFFSWAHDRSNESVTQYPGMWNAYLIKINGRIGVFNIGHHIICDALNVTNLYRKIINELCGQLDESEPYSVHLEENNHYLESRQYNRDQQYWEPILSKEAHFAFSGLPIGKCDNITVTLPPIKSLCLKLRLTEASVIYSAVGILLMRLQNLKLLSIGIPVLGRTSQREINALGLYMHDVPLILRGGERSFSDIAAETQNNLFDLFRHQRYDLPPRALFDVSVDYSVFPNTEDYDAHVIYNDYVSTAMEFHFLQREQLELTVRSQKGLFKDINVITDVLCKILQTVLLDPNCNIMTLPIAELPKEGEKHEIAEESLYSLIERRNTGNIIDGHNRYSIAELLQCAELIDVAVRGKKRIIALVCERGFLELAAIYGIIRGGNAYLPISHEYPLDRIQLVLKQSECDTILIQRKFKNLVPDAMIIEDILETEPPVVILPVAALPDDILYVIFTSGSTGTPKGAAITNRSAVNRIQWMCSKYFTEKTVVMHKTPYTFDVSVWEIFGFAFGGFSLYILPPEDHYRQDRIIEHIRKGSVTDLHFVPAVFGLFLDALKKDGGTLPSLNNIFLSGETLNASLVNRAPAPVHNLYGPTECTVDVTFYDCLKIETDPVPIGKPIDNCQILVVDQNLQLLPAGIVGQICVSGLPVGCGYVNDLDKTSESFVSNPYGTGKLYLTGDFGYLRNDGQLVFVGRNDQQVKIHGQRVEIGEIEAALNPLVSSCAVMLKNGQLVAFYTGEECSDLHDKLGKLLPRYMVPQQFFYVDKMPLTASGKIDRNTLSTISIPDRPYLPPIGEYESLICDRFSQILETSPVSRTDNFYDLGGTSLSMMELLSEKPLDKMSPSDFMSNPTPAQLARLLTKGVEESSLSVLYYPDNASSIYVLFPFAGGDAAGYTALVKEFQKRKSQTGLLFVSWGCDYTKVANELKSLTLPVFFYSHCAGAVIAMKLLDILPCVSGFIIGANIPPEKMLNIWKSVSDDDVLDVLYRAGMPQLPSIKTSSMIHQFRENTDEYFDYFQQKKIKSSQRVSLVLGRDDFFTESSGSKAAVIWERYFFGVDKIYYIDSSNHYFQSVNAEKLTNILITEVSKCSNI